MKLKATLEARARKLGRRGRLSSAGSHPEALYARILDGDSIWLAIEGDGLDGPVGLRLPGSRDVLELVDDSGVQEPGRLVVRSELARALPDVEAVYDLVVTQRGVVTPVRITELPVQSPMRTPRSRDGRWQHALGRTVDDTLQVVRQSAARVADLVGIGTQRDGFVLTVADPDASSGAPPAVVVLDGEVVAELPGEAVGEGRVRYSVGASDIPRVEDATFTVEILGAHGRVPVTRRRHVLTHPFKALELPEFGVDEPDAGGIVRVRIGAAGELLLRRPKAGA